MYTVIQRSQKYTNISYDRNNEQSLLPKQLLNVWIFCDGPEAWLVVFPRLLSYIIRYTWRRVVTFRFRFNYSLFETSTTNVDSSEAPPVVQEITTAMLSLFISESCFLIVIYSSCNVIYYTHLPLDGIISEM